MRQVAINPATLRATFREGEKMGEGLFTADVVDFPVDAGYGMGYDIGFYSIYNVMVITAEQDAFIDWQPVLAQCARSLEFSDAFVQSTINISNEQVATSLQISAAANDTLNGIMSSWEGRNASQDIASQKQSDATLGYERVYDTDTGEVYKAYNGFIDEYAGSRYQSATDDMYAKPIDGYIEK